MSEQDPRLDAQEPERAAEKTDGGEKGGGAEETPQPELTVILPDAEPEESAESGDNTETAVAGPANLDATLVLPKDGAQGVPQGDAPPEEATESIEVDDTEEVLVILPADVDAEIPLAATEVVPDEVLAEEATDEITEVTNVALERDEATDTSPTELAEPCEMDTEAVGTEGIPSDHAAEPDLERLAASLDDETLGVAGYEQELEADEEPAGIATSELDALDEAELLAGAAFAGTEGGGWKRIVLPLAAVLTVACAGLYFASPALRDFFSERSASAVTSAPTPPSQGTEAPIATTAGGPGHGGIETEGVEQGSATPRTEDLDVRKEFKEQVLLALRLGFTGEVAE